MSTTTAPAPGQLTLGRVTLKAPTTVVLDAQTAPSSLNLLTALLAAPTPAEATELLLPRPRTGDHDRCEPAA